MKIKIIVSDFDIEKHRKLTIKFGLYTLLFPAFIALLGFIFITLKAHYSF